MAKRTTHYTDFHGWGERELPLTSPTTPPPHPLSSLLVLVQYAGGYARCGVGTNVGVVPRCGTSTFGAVPIRRLVLVRPDTCLVGPRTTLQPADELNYMWLSVLQSQGVQQGPKAFLLGSRKAARARVP